MFWGCGFFLFNGFPVKFPVFNNHAPKGKAKGLVAGVSAETCMFQGIRPLRLWMLRREKHVLSLPLAVHAMPVWWIWAGSSVS